MRPGNIKHWAYGDVTGDEVRLNSRLAKHLKAVAKIDKKLAEAEARLAKLEAKKSSVLKNLSGWLGSWF